MDSNRQSQLPPKFRLLLDQGFPLPPRFDPRSVDQTIEVTHLFQFDRTLSERSTPDWEVYCRAAEGGFDAMVTRDLAQTSQTVEMFVLSRLTQFTILTWKKPIEDPIREWGQLLAYLPEIKKRLSNGDRGVIVLPAPKLTTDNIVRPTAVLGTNARARRIGVEEIRAEARSAIQDWSGLIHGDRDRFNSLLRIRPQRRVRRP